MSLENETGVVVVVSGPSGVGKTTVAEKLVEEGICERIVTTTTRTPSAGENDGVDYDFISKKDFLRKVDKGWFLEYAEVYGNYYGTPLSKVQHCLHEGKAALLLIDVQGARQVRRAGLPALYIFLAPPDEQTLQNRLYNRKRDAQQDMDLRLSISREELKAKDEYDHVVVNDDLTGAVQQIHGLIQAERHKRSGQA